MERKHWHTLMAFLIPVRKNPLVDLLDHIMDEMYKEDAEAKKKMVTIYQKDSSVMVMTTTLDLLASTNPTERPDDWVFIGYIAFCFYGCPILTEKDDRLVSFTTGACLKLKLKVNVLQERLLVNKILIVGTKLLLSN
jgi:hypothetical protein